MSNLLFTSPANSSCGGQRIFCFSPVQAVYPSYRSYVKVGIPGRLPVQKPSVFTAWYTKKKINTYFSLCHHAGLWATSKSPSAIAVLADDGTIQLTSSVTTAYILQPLWINDLEGNFIFKEVPGRECSAYLMSARLLQKDSPQWPEWYWCVHAPPWLRAKFSIVSPRELLSFWLIRRQNERPMFTSLMWYKVLKAETSIIFQTTAAPW